MTTNGRRRPVRGSAALLGAVVVAATAVPADADTGDTNSSGTTALSGLAERAANLRQDVTEAHTAYLAAKARAAALRTEAARARAAADEAVRYAQDLYDKVSDRSTGIGDFVAGLGDGDHDLDEAVRAVQAQDAALQAAAETDRRRAAADQAAEQARVNWTELAAEAARLELRVEAETVAGQALRLARFSPSYKVPARLQDLRNRAALESWRAYLTALADALVVPPAASRLADPASLPAPLAPVLDPAGKPVPGVAQVWRVGADPLVVLPAETIRAVTEAFTLVGQSVAGADAFACGGFTRAVWRAAGYRLPAGSEAQWQTLARTDREHPQAGDLIYLGDRRFGLHRAGIYLGARQWIAVNSATGEVAVETLPATGVYAARRATLPKPSALTWLPDTMPGWTRTGCGELRPPAALEAHGGVNGSVTTTSAPASVTATSAAWTLPVAAGAYRLSSEFGAAGNLWSGGRHTGQDFAAPVGTPVRAALDGVVTVEHPAWAGTLVRVQHANGVETWYAHLSVVAVRTGQRITAGALIGAVGNEGNSTGPHLHFEIRVDGAPVDPLPVLFPDTAPARWGGYANGTIPAAALCALAPGRPLLLRCDAAVAFRLLDGAYTARFGRPITVSDAYRALSEQQTLFAAKPNLAAVPGTSNHGWGLAVDLAAGAERFGTAEHEWLAANGPRFGWRHPDWARQGGSRPEPWHFEFGTSP